APGHLGEEREPHDPRPGRVPPGAPTRGEGRGGTATSADAGPGRSPGSPRPPGGDSPSEVDRPGRGGPQCRGTVRAGAPALRRRGANRRAADHTGGGGRAVAVRAEAPGR